MRLRLDAMASPIGALRLLHDDDGCLRALDFEGCEARTLKLMKRRYGGDHEIVSGTAPRAIIESLVAYFDGDLDAAGRVDFKTSGTAFQEAAWAALRAIPAGETRSYGQQAVAIGRARAMRAIGRANGDNPIAIVTPCHRVIGADGDLTGFGGGLSRKRWLLKHEGAL